MFSYLSMFYLTDKQYNFIIMVRHGMIMVEQNLHYKRQTKQMLVTAESICQVHCQFVRT